MKTVDQVVAEYTVSVRASHMHPDNVPAFIAGLTIGSLVTMDMAEASKKAGIRPTEAAWSEEFNAKVRGEFTRYMERVHPELVSEVQRRTLWAAFICGANHTMMAFIQVACSMSEDAATDFCGQWIEDTERLLIDVIAERKRAEALKRLSDCPGE